MEKQKNPHRSNPLNRRDFLKFSGAGLAGLAASSTLGENYAQARPAAGERPNIVFIIADDTGWNDVGYHGSEIETPCIDRMAASGVELDRFYACPTCSPTRASVIMGRPPSRYGILGPIAGRSALSLPTDEPTLPSILAGAGYRTALTGKWHLGLKPETGPNKYGFESSCGYLHGQIDQYTHIYKNGDRSWHRNGEFIEQQGHASDLIAGEAIKYIESFGGKDPFFCYVAFSVPHYPVQEEDRWIKPYEGKIENESRRLYAASMTHMDACIGRILDALENNNLASETLVVFVSDNGGQEDWVARNNEYESHHGPYDRLGDNKPLRGWKGSLYEGGIRVPAVFYWPGRLEARKVSETIHAMDLFPTFAGLAGAEIPADKKVEGIDIRPATEGGSLEGERTLYWNTGSQLAVRRGDWKLIWNGGSMHEGNAELYNVVEDPYEKKDLSGEKLTLATQLREIMAEERAMDHLSE